MLGVEAIGPDRYTPDGQEGRVDIVVQKYGGSSVADVEHIERVADRMVQTIEGGDRVVAVVSAMGNTTNELLELSRQITATPAARELDMLLTVGERITMALLSMALHARGHEAVSFTGSMSGIITNASHTGARVVEVRPFRVQDALDEGKVVIVAGFQGVSYRREITTLGRGGSDTTAIALAAALGARHCEICSDVDGVYTTDPRVVSDARLLDAITHDEMLDLSEGGARVLHSAAIDYARRHGIAIYARSTFGQPETGGTIVRVDLDGARPEVTAVAGRKDRVAIRRNTSSASEALVWLHGLSEGLGDGDVAPVRTAVTGTEPAVAEALYELENVPDPEGFVERLQGRHADAVMSPVHGVVVVVGPDVGTSASFSAAAWSALGDLQGEALGFETRPRTVEIRLPTAAVDEAVRRLHAALIPSS
jgi:aspartate kinase